MDATKPICSLDWGAPRAYAAPACSSAPPPRSPTSSKWPSSSCACPSSSRSIAATRSSWSTSWATYPSPRRRPSSSSSFSHSDQHTTRWDVAESEVVVITAAHHPLFGQCFPVVRRLHQQGEPHVVVRLPFGATQLLPSRWTRGTPSFPTAAAAPSPAAAARALVRIVGTLRERSSPQQEVLDVAADRSHDPPHVPRPALGHVHAARTLRPGGALDGPAGSTHPRPASGAQSRRVPGRTGRPAGEQQGERMPQRRTR